MIQPKMLTFVKEILLFNCDVYYDWSQTVLENRASFYLNNCFQLVGTLRKDEREML